VLEKDCTGGRRGTDELPRDGGGRLQLARRGGLVKAAIFSSAGAVTRARIADTAISITTTDYEDKGGERVERKAAIRLNMGAVAESGNATRYRGGNPLRAEGKEIHQGKNASLRVTPKKGQDRLKKSGKFSR